MSVAAEAGESTYAGIVRLVTAAQTAKAPFVRLADRYALIFLPVTIAVATFAWLISGDLIRSLAVLVAATPCPLILAAPVAFIAGVAQAAHGDRHVYASRTRFIPDSLLGCFESRVWPEEPAGERDPAERKPEPQPVIDVASRIRALWQ